MTHFKSKKQRQAVMSSLNCNKSNTSKFQDRLNKNRQDKISNRKYDDLNQSEKDYFCNVHNINNKQEYDVYIIRKR